MSLGGVRSGQTRGYFLRRLGHQHVSTPVSRQVSVTPGDKDRAGTIRITVDAAEVCVGGASDVVELLLSMSCIRYPKQ